MDSPRGRGGGYSDIFIRSLFGFKILNFNFFYFILFFFLGGGGGFRKMITFLFIYLFIYFFFFGGGGGQKNEYFLRHEDLVDIFWESSQNWTIFWGHYYAF